MGHGSFTGIRIGLATTKAICDVKQVPCLSVSSLEALAYTVPYTENTIICPMIDAKHSNIYTGIFETKNGKIMQKQDFEFCNIHDFLPHLNSLKKKIFFVGNCGILYKDVIKSYLKSEIEILEDIFPSSKYVGIAGYNKYNCGIVENSFEISALYIKNSSAEEKTERNNL